MNKVLILTILALSMYASAQSVESLMSTGNDLLSSGAYSQAAARFKQVVQRDPGNFEAQFNLAYSYMKWARYSEALREFKKAAGIEPRNGDVLLSLGICYQQLNEIGPAIDAYSKAIQANPENVQARLNLAGLQAGMRHSGEAIAQYKQVLSLEPRNGTALSGLAELLTANKNYSDAKRYLNDAIDSDPGNADAHWQLGEIVWKQDKDFSRAEKEFQQAISLDHSSADYYVSLGTLLEDQGKKEQAIELYKESFSYLSDPLKKEELRKRIDNMENLQTATDPQKGVTMPSRTKTDVDALKKEVRGDRDAEGQKQIDVGSNDITSDLLDLPSPNEGTTLDLRGDAKKKRIEKDQQGK